LPEPKQIGLREQQRNVLLELIMTTKRVVYMTADGLHIIVPGKREVAEVKAAAAKLGQTMTDAQLATVACAGALVGAPDGIDPLICDLSDIPSDRTFRAAWTRDGATPVSVNMDQARGIAQASIRATRAPLLTALDVEFTRAQGSKDQATADAVEARRQTLRDAPADARIINAVDPAALKTAMTAVLADMQTVAAR
jgi:hypothetical protein